MLSLLKTRQRFYVIIIFLLWLYFFFTYILSVQFNCSVMSDFLQPHGLQHTRLPCPPPTPRVCSNSCPQSRWCHHPVIPFSSRLQSFPALGSFPWVSSSLQGVKVLELQLQHQSSSEYSGLISFRSYWFDLLAVQGTLQSLLHIHFRHYCNTLVVKFLNLYLFDLTPVILIE